MRRFHFKIEHDANNKDQYKKTPKRPWSRLHIFGIKLSTDIMNGTFFVTLETLGMKLSVSCSTRLAKIGVPKNGISYASRERILN